MKVLKEDLKRWNRMEFGNVGVNKKKLLDKLARLDEKDGVHGLYARGEETGGGNES